jgi:hypothetical protein
MVKFAVMIKEQLRSISQAQVQNGAVVGPAFATIRELVAQHGRAYSIRPLPRGRRSREPQACYANALHAANRKWVYVEGNSKTGQSRCVARLGNQSPEFKRSLRPDVACWARILWHSIQAQLCGPNMREHRASWRSGRLGIGMAATPGR